MTFRCTRKGQRAFLLTLLSFCVSFAHAQYRNNEVSLSAGPFYGYIQDRHASPVTYSVNGMHFGLRFIRQRLKSCTRIDLAGTVGKSVPRHLRTAFMDLQWPDDILGQHETEHVSYQAEYIDVRMSFEYLRAIHTSNCFKVWAGSAIDGSIMYTEISRYFWPLSVNGISFSARSMYNVGKKHELRAGISSYVIGFVSRFDYASDPSLPNTTVVRSFFKEDTHLRTLKDLQRIDFSMEYQYKLSTRIRCGLQCRALWLSMQIPRHLRIIQGNYEALISLSI